MRAHPLTALALGYALLACIAEPTTPERFVARLRAGDTRELWLSQTGLYADIAAKRVAKGLRAYTPAFPLWSDGAAKHRWLYLPRAARIDSSDMDSWLFPVGTVAFKEFSQRGRRVETRVIARLDAGRYWMGAFVWNDDESDALFSPEGRSNARDTAHDVPSASQCESCHNGEPGKLLGFSAVQTPRTPAELLTHPIAERFAPPGEPLAVRALGYLHGNCAHCHNPQGIARPDTALDLRLSVHDRAVAATAAYRTSVGRPTQSFTALPRRVEPGAPERSALVARMSTRDPAKQMPPLGTERIDHDGVAAVHAWVRSLDRERAAR